ncbi:hypothetical protein [Phenylobacterium koreense]|uniref:MFS transporter n=1 Tax=Phenylobacterium koreense TaxID=266125 RepID=A0ABV2EN99_9CAUL
MTRATSGHRLQGWQRTGANVRLTAVLLFVVNLLGYGLGPLFIGAVSDVIFSMQVADLGLSHLTREACEGAARTALAAAEQGACAVAHPQSLQRALLITSGFYAVSGAFFLITCRWLRRDMVAK